MRTILLAGGYGTRLRPLTNTIPKCLVPIKGKALLEIWLERLTVASFSPFLINTHYLSNQVEEFIKNTPYCHQVKLVHEPELLGTAGTLMANLDFFQGSDGLLIHADNYCLADFKAFYKAHQQRPDHCLITMMTFRTDNPMACGIVETNTQGVVENFHEKVTSPPSNLANGAIYILSPQCLSLLEMNFKTATDFSTEVLPHFLGRIYTHETSEIFMDIGTTEAYQKANMWT